MSYEAVELNPCPFCGGYCDPHGWKNGKGERGPECMNCGATAPNVDTWQRTQSAEKAAYRGYVAGAFFFAPPDTIIGHIKESAQGWVNFEYGVEDD